MTNSKRSRVNVEHALMLIAAVAVIALIMSGCTTGGLVVGPLSYLSAKSNEGAVNERAMLTAQLPAEKKPQVLSAMRMGAGSGEIAAGVGVDFVALYAALKGRELTWGEFGQQTLAVLGDAALYTVAGAAAKDALDDKNDDGGSVAVPTMSVSGSGNTIVVNNSASVSVDNSVTN